MSHPAHNPLQPFVENLVSRSLLGSAEQAAILSLPAYLSQVQTNRDFVSLGERVEHATFVVAGMVGRFGQNRDGNRQITAVYISGDMANLHSVVAPDACAALQALSVTTILRVPHTGLREVASQSPRIAEAFWRECVVDAAVLAEWVVNVGCRNAKSRMAHLLCEFTCRVEGRDSEKGLPTAMPATQAHLANMTGLTAVHVNRTLRSLREDGLITLKAGMLTVLDWDRLARLADFDSAYLRIGRLAPSAI